MDWKYILRIILDFGYTISHGVGYFAVWLLQSLFPWAPSLQELADPIGILIVLSLFLLITHFAKKVALAIIMVGWFFIGVRVMIAIFS